MIFVTYILHSKLFDRKVHDYATFESISEFLNWFESQGDELYFSLTSGKESLTESGWVKQIESPAQILRVVDTKRKTVTRINTVISDDGILFDDIRHCSKSFVRQMALKREIAYKDI